MKTRIYAAPAVKGLNMGTCIFISQLRKSILCLVKHIGYILCLVIIISQIHTLSGGAVFLY